jgi:ABC-type transport system substrate-binding protein
MKAFIIAIFSLVAITSINSCQTTEDAVEEKDKKLGGEIVIPMASFFKVESPNSVKKVESAQIHGQILESLVRYNPNTLEIEPSLAESWTVSDDNLIYTFKLRENVKFHDNACFKDGKGRNVTMKDVEEMFYRIYENNPENTAYSIFQNTIVGGDAFFNGESDKISGLELNDNSIKVKLKKASNTFLAKLVTIYGSVIPEESFSTDGWTAVGTGPFEYDKKQSTSELIILNKNKNYWMLDSNGVQLPYLDVIKYKFYEDNSIQMKDFWDGNLTIVKNVPINKVSEVLEDRIDDFQGENAKYILESVPQMSTTYLEFNMNSDVMKNIKVRQAINFAIDRKRLVEKTLRNQAFEIGKFGLTPPLTKIFKDYDFEGIEDAGYTRNTIKAKQLMAEAGYPDGKGFPTITAQFKLDNDMFLIMSEIQNQLQSVLNINMDIEQIEFNQLIENNALGKADIFENVWIGDFPSAESYLLNFYGKLVPADKETPSNTNTSRYINAEFDEMFEKGISAKSMEEANTFFAEAEKILMNNPPIAVLFYGENLWLKQSSFKNFSTNGMNYVDFTEVYIDKTKLEVVDSETESTEVH